MILPSLLLLIASPAPTQDFLGVKALDVQGQVHALGIENGTRPVALVFLDPECPVSNRYGTRLGELSSEAAGLGVQFFGVLSDPALSAKAAEEYTRERAFGFPVLFDTSGDLARRFGPEVVPEAFVVDRYDELAYRGRIDDLFVARGKTRASVTRHDLLEALRAVAEEEAPEVGRTEAVGCVFEAWDSRGEGDPVTWTRDVAPLLRAQCVDCHRPGDIGPFPLLTYEDARRRAKTLAATCEERFMPPWQATQGFGHFRDERVLTEEEIGLLRAWADAGAPRGDDDDLLPAPPLPDERWRLGTPDLEIALPVEFPVPADGDDIYQYFVIPHELVGDRQVVAIDFRPGDPSVVHHCLAYHDHSGRARRLDEADPGIGFSMFGADTDFLQATNFAGWAPGAQPYRLPAGTAQELKSGGDFVLEIHYHPNGRATTDRSALGLYFADEPVDRLAVGLVMGTEDIVIEPGEGDYRRRVWMEVPADVELVDVSPHMHYLGRTVETVATLPDGLEIPLIQIPRWDFRWQGAYVYRDPIYLPQGTRIEARFSFDNTAENPFNPTSPPSRVEEGWRTTDEMCLFYFTVIPVDPGSTRSLVRASLSSFGRSARDDS